MAIHNKWTEPTGDERVDRVRRELFGNELTVEQAAQALGIGSETMRQLLRNHELDGVYQHNREWHIPVASLTKWVHRLEERIEPMRMAEEIRQSQRY